MSVPKKCPKCGYENWSQFDKAYADTYGCWGCDKLLWEEKKKVMSIIVGITSDPRDLK